VQVTFPAEKHHRPKAGTKLYCLVTEAHACEQHAQGCYLEVDGLRFEPATFGSERMLCHYATQATALFKRTRVPSSIWSRLYGWIVTTWLLLIYVPLTGRFPPNHAKFCGYQLKNAVEYLRSKICAPGKRGPKFTKIAQDLLPPKTSHHTKFDRDRSNQLGGKR